ncbi:hypothetical protein L2E82_06390 [Cichorium intybus]|uniref:Uncharacterized protein n=1 Tax=Cichorium intybus TaxID=13427 RepID=A0ACB9HAN3_CICIN|nr:hypothetical protein L2E82_06390 [Cichorium intybus]
MSSEFRIPAELRRRSFQGVANEEINRTDIISESVEASFGDKRYVLRVSEVEGKLFKPCRLDKGGDYNQITAGEESEEDKDWESDSLSDEDQLISSDDGTNVGFSEEDDEQFNLDDDAISVVRETVFENAINTSTTRAREKSETHAMGGDEFQDTISTTPKRAKEVRHATDEDEESIVQETFHEEAFIEPPAQDGHKNDGHVTVVHLPDAGDTPKTQKNQEVNVKDPVIGLYACDLNQACSMGVCLSNHVGILKDPPAHVGDKKEGNCTIDVARQEYDINKTQIQVKEIVKEKESSAHVGDKKELNNVDVALKVDESNKNQIQGDKNALESNSCTCVSKYTCACALIEKPGIPILSIHNFPMGFIPEQLYRQTISEKTPSEDISSLWDPFTPVVLVYNVQT